VIINIINIDRMTVVEAECYTPIPGDRYSPKTSEIRPSAINKVRILKIDPVTTPARKQSNVA